MILNSPPPHLKKCPFPGVGWRDGEKMQTTELNNNKKKENVIKLCISYNKNLKDLFVKKNVHCLYLRDMQYDLSYFLKQQCLK